MFLPPLGERKKSISQRLSKATVSLKRLVSTRKVEDEFIPHHGTVTSISGGDALAERVRRFVPRRLLERLARDGPATGPEIQAQKAAVGFFDVSGFTKLGTELSRQVDVRKQTARRQSHGRLSSLGSSLGKTTFAAVQDDSVDPAELLTTQLNGIFSSIIDIIELYGGDIIKFVGDAMIVVWRADEEDDSAHLGVVALTCAQEAVSAMQFANPKLGIHIAVSIGDIYECIVGGHEGKYECFVAGPACQDTFQGVDAAKRGETVVPSRVWDRLVKAAEKAGGSLIGSGKGDFIRLISVDVDGLEPPPLPPLPQPTRKIVDAAGPFLPRPFLSALDPRRGGARCEMRKLAIIFMSISGLEKRFTRTDSKDVRHAFSDLQRVVVAIQEACAKHGAVLRQFVFDDKGFVAVVCAGLPTMRETEDEPGICALRVILELKAKKPDVVTVTKFGLTTGDCLCGTVGSVLDMEKDDEAVPRAGRQEYAVVGNPVNLAARLMSKSKPGQVRVGVHVQEAASRCGFVFDQLESFVPKGKTEPVINFELDFPKSMSNGKRRGRDTFDKFIVDDKRHDVTFVDRAGATDACRRLLLPATDPHYLQSLVVAGGSGQGKTKFLEYTSSKLAGTGALVLVASCLAQHRGTPYAGFKQLVSRAVRWLLRQLPKGTAEAPAQVSTSPVKKGGRRQFCSMRSMLVARDDLVPSGDTATQDQPEPRVSRRSLQDIADIAVTKDDEAPMGLAESILSKDNKRPPKPRKCRSSTSVCNIHNPVVVTRKRDESSRLLGDDESDDDDDNDDDAACGPLENEEPVDDEGWSSNLLAPTTAALQLTRLVELGYCTSGDARVLCDYLVPTKTVAPRVMVSAMAAPGDMDDASFAKTEDTAPAEDEASGVRGHPPHHPRGDVAGAIVRLLETCVVGSKLMAPPLMLAILIDNAEYVDAWSCKLLLRLRDMNIRFVLTHRSVRSNRRFDAVKATMGTTHEEPQHHHHTMRRSSWGQRGPSEKPSKGATVTLGPLTENQIRDLIKTGPYAKDGVVVSSGLVEFLKTRSAGNPFVVLEVLHELVERGVCALDPETREFKLQKDAEFIDFQIPESVRVSIASGLDNLGSAAQAVLRFAAVMGASAGETCLVYLFWVFFGHCMMLQASSGPWTTKNDRGQSIRKLSSKQDSSISRTSSSSSTRSAAADTLTFEVFGPVNLLETLQKLIKLKFFSVRDNTSSGEQQQHHNRQFVFCSDVVRHVVYHRMLASDRRRVHTQVVAYHTFRLGASPDASTDSIRSSGGEVQKYVVQKMMMLHHDRKKWTKYKSDDDPDDDPKARMALYGQVAYHALHAKLELVAFHFCLRAFGAALEARQIDVALGYVNDCSLITENHPTIPPELKLTAHIYLMRAAAHTEANHYDAAIDDLEMAEVEAKPSEEKATTCVLWRRRLKAPNSRPQKIILHGEGVALQFPADGSVLSHFKDFVWDQFLHDAVQLPRRATLTKRRVQRAKRRIDHVRRRLRAAFAHDLHRVVGVKDYDKPVSSSSSSNTRPPRSTRIVPGGAGTPVTTSISAASS